MFERIFISEEKWKYMKVERLRDMMTNEHITIDSNSCEKVNNFKYLGSWLENQNSIHEAIKFILKAGN